MPDIPAPASKTKEHRHTVLVELHQNSAITISTSDGQTLYLTVSIYKTKKPFTFPNVLTLFYDLTEMLLK